MKKIIYILFLLLVVSCSPQKRLNRLIDKHPELVQKDTINFKDTIIVPGPTANFNIPFTNFKDNIKFEEKNGIKIFYKIEHDTVKINVEVAIDTVYINKKIPIEKIKYITKIKTKFSLFEKLSLCGIGFLVLILLLRFGIR